MPVDLLKAVSIERDPAALARVAKLLGRVGDERALAAIGGLGPRAKGPVAFQASFAASLIAYRLGLPGHELPAPRVYVDMPPGPTFPVSFAAPTREDMASLQECLAREPFGVKVSVDSALMYSCSMVAFDGQLGPKTSLRVLAERKLILGLVASRSHGSGPFSVAYFIFSTPDPATGGANIAVHRITGRAAWAGPITKLADDRADFTLRTVGRVGTVPLEIEGSLRPGGALVVTRAVSAGRVLEKRHLVADEPAC